MDDNETDSLMKTERQQRRVHAQGDDRKVIREDSLQGQHAESRMPLLNPTETNEGCHSKQTRNHRREQKSAGRSTVLSKTPEYQHHVEARPSSSMRSHRQGDFTVKADGNGDQQPSGQLDSRSPDTIARRSHHSNVSDRGQGTSQALLTFLSQPFSHAAALGTPSLLSQWSPHNGETLTEDERSLSAFTRLHQSLSIGKQCPGRPLFASINGHDLHLYKNENHCHSLSPRPTEPSTDVPFGSYMKNTNDHRLL